MIAICILLVAFLPSLTFAANLPEGFDICKQSDPNFNQCFKHAALKALPIIRHGVKELGLHPLDPIHVPSVTIMAGSSTVRFEQKYKNYKIYGFDDVDIFNISSKFNENGVELTMKYFLPNCTIVTDYEFNGHILILPITGNGEFLMKLKNMEVALNVTIQVDNERKYSQAKNVTIDMEPENIHFHLSNLFNGNDALGNEINSVMNENWFDVYLDAKDGYNDLIATIYKSYLNNILKRVPYDDIFPK